MSVELNDGPDLVATLKALADASRLRIVGLLAERERRVDEIASLLGLTAPTVSHHLNRLKAAALISMRPEGVSHLYRLDVQALGRLSKTLLAPASVGPPGAVGDEKVLRDFLVDGRLKQIPASHTKRGVVLRWLANEFEADRRYTEREVNEVLKRHHEDVATLRRELVGAGLMERERGVYWKVSVAAAIMGSSTP